MRDSKRQLERQVAALESRAPGTYGHARRVSAYAERLARDAGLAWSQVRRVRQGGAVHDIGKVGISGEILNKRAPLSEREQEVVARHAEIGAGLVDGAGYPQLAAIVRHHHERWDGDGYPHGLAGTEIPVGARIVAVCDTFDALTSRRPYRRPIGHPQALDILAEEAGTQLDPDLVALFRQRFAAVWLAAAAA